ncbi:MAG: cobalamin biosynthesis protein CobQ [Leptolyngbyaceae cyanobacterium T60_A2020_046]|nr:cobalamin biosynthesis protein CobQ [Leptolyngbyaceae cyanobacterium T60_A2020_046]
MVATLVKRYLLALQRYKWAGLAGFLGVLGASSVVAIQPPPPEEYVSEGILVQNAPVVAFTATGAELQQQGQGIITTDFLLADVLLQQVVQELTQQGIEVTPQTIRRNTTIEIDAEDQQLQRVSVAYVANTREEAEAVLNLLFQGMVELSGVTNRARLSNIVNALNQRLPEVEAELRDAEQALEAYDRTEGPAIQAALDGSLLAAISGSQNQRRENLITLAGIDAQMRSLQQQLGLNPAQAYASSALSADPIVAQLRARIYEAETQLELLSDQFRPAHPTMVQLRQDLSSYEQLLRQRAAEVIGGGGLAPLPSGAAVRQDSNLDPARAALANQLVALQTQRDALLQQQEVLAQSEVQLRKQYSSLPNKQLERDRLAQQVALKKALYDQIQAKRIDAEAAEAETVSSLTISTPPATSLVEVETRSPLVVLLIGGVLGLVVGGGIVYLLDMLDGTIRTYEDLDNLFEGQGIPLLGLIPDIPPSSHASALITAPDSPYGDIYERLRSNLQISGMQLLEGKVPRVVLITSTRNREGKTTTAFNLGIASARAGRRTLIVEADLRNPSQAHRLGITPDESAALEPLRYYSGYLSDPVRMVPGVENLYVSPSAGPQRNPAAVIDSSEMEHFLADVKARFDLVILDAPHLTSSNDALLLESRTDGMVLVSRPGLTEKPILTTAIEQLEENEDVTLLGAVINSAQIPVASAQSETSSRLVEADPAISVTEAPAREVPVMSQVDF